MVLTGNSTSMRKQTSRMPFISFPSAISVQFTFSCLGSCKVAKQTCNCERCQFPFLQHPQFLLRIFLKPLSLDFTQEKKSLSSSLQVEGRETSLLLEHSLIILDKSIPLPLPSLHSHYN